MRLSLVYALAYGIVVAPGVGWFRYGKPGKNGTTAWSTASCSCVAAKPGSGTVVALQVELRVPTPGMVMLSSPSTLAVPVEPRLAASPLAKHNEPATTASAMSTTSSFGRRPFGKPAASDVEPMPATNAFTLPLATTEPSTPRRFWDASATTGRSVFSRSISAGTTFAG